MARILRFIYPGGEPLLGSIDIIQPLLRAAVKYQMDDVVKKVSSALLQVETDPLRIYAVAKSCTCEDIASVAARRTLKFALGTYPRSLPSVLMMITAGDYHRLRRYHRRCSVPPLRCFAQHQLAPHQSGPWAPRVGMVLLHLLSQTRARAGA